MKRRTDGRTRSVSRILAALFVLLGVSMNANVTLAQVSIDCAYFATGASAPAGSPEAAEASPVAIVPFPGEGGELTVFAAASLTEAFEAAAANIQAANPEVTITYNFAGSHALVTQLTEGAEADVFASANISQMTAAQDAGVLGGEPVLFAQNELVIVVPADNPAGIETAADLANDGVLFVTALEDVPVGQYTRQSLCLMGADTATYGDGFVDAVSRNIVSEEENVRAVVTKVSLGEADAGVVYSTDVTADVAGSLIVIPIAPEFNVLTDYPIAPVAEGDAGLAAAYISYITGPEGQATLAEFGFLPKP